MDELHDIIDRARTACVPAVDRALPDPVTPSWALAPETARLVGNLAVGLKSRSILEFGAGRSSLVLAAALAVTGGGRLTSIDHLPSYAQPAWSRVDEVPGVDAELLEAPLRLALDANGLRYVYDVDAAALERRGPFDLVLVDGPPFFFGRDGTVPAVLPWLAPGSVIVMDDARRRPEQGAIRRWLATRPGLDLVLMEPGFGGELGNGVAVLRYDGRPERRGSIAAFLGASADQLLTWRHLRWKLRGRRSERG
jgi:predicted O-methyltransferase YrrM